MRRRVRLTLVATSVTFLLFAPAPPAGACTCAAAGSTTHLRNASLAFVGKAESTVDEPEGLVTTFTVGTIYKGTLPARVRISTARNGAACGVPFVEGRTYVVFAHAGAGIPTTTLCSGTTDDLSATAGLLPIAVPSSPRAAPPERPSGASRTAPIAVAGLLIAALAAASGLAVRASRRPRPIA